VIIKLNAIGSFSVGKTSLIRRYTENRFSEDYLPTLGVDITVKRLTIDDERIRLVLLDTAGEEKFGRIRSTYFEGSLGCLVVYDISRYDTFEDLPVWIYDYRKVAKENPFITIIGNKIDLEDIRVVPMKEGKKFARVNGFQFYECSAKIGGIVISKIFIELIRKILSRISAKKE
jgi:small GTP-binding protein